MLKTHENSAEEAIRVDERKQVAAWIRKCARLSPSHELTLHQLAFLIEQGPEKLEESLKDERYLRPERP